MSGSLAAQTSGPKTQGSVVNPVIPTRPNRLHLFTYHALRITIFDLQQHIRPRHQCSTDQQMIR